MNALVLYASTHGSTQRVAEKASGLFSFPHDLRNVKDGVSLTGYRLLLFFAPTYGDEELQEEMEQFLIGYRADLAGTQYAICELGNYYGYDDFTYGAKLIIGHHLEALGAQECLPALSLDSLPKKDWNLLARWCKTVNKAYARL